MAALTVSLAEELFDAATGGVAADRPSERHSLSLDDAYGVQQALVGLLGTGADRVVGYKVALTAAWQRAALGSDEPQFGCLLHRTVRRSGATIPTELLFQPRVEAEVAFRLGKDLRGPGVTVDRARAAVDQCFPAIEIVDSRYGHWGIGLCDLVADNGAASGAVLGRTVAELGDRDTSTVHGEILKNGVPSGDGDGTSVLGDPLLSLTWLANRLGASGRTLAAGDIVLSGSLTHPLDVAAGDHIAVSLSGLGTVSCTMGPASDSRRGAVSQGSTAQ